MLLMLQASVGYAQSMKQIMERNWQGVSIQHRGSFQGFPLRLDLTNVVYNESNKRFKAIITTTLTAKQGTFYDVSEYTGEFNPPDVVTFEHNRIINQHELPGGLKWLHEYFSAKITTDSDHKGHFVLMDDAYARKIVFTTYPYANK